MGLPIEGVSNHDQLKWLMEAGEESGHWIITGRPVGRFRYELTAEGAALLAQEPSGRD